MDNYVSAYYPAKVGEIFNSRYVICSLTGQGAFGNVFLAKDGNGADIAIKILRNGRTMELSGLNEVEMLTLLNDNDCEDKFHCLRLFTYLYHKQHLCLVMEPMHLNLREVLNDNGGGLGIEIIQSYGQQLLSALNLLKKCGIVHADIKPDNIMVDSGRSVLKLCDFGSAVFVGEGNVTSYMVSQYYRGPEVILGFENDHPLDMWSLGTTLYEIYTGKFMFPGKNNNDMLKLFMELKGKFSKKLILSGLFRQQHFDWNCNYLYKEVNPVTGNEKVTVMCCVASRNLEAELIDSQKLTVDLKQKVWQFLDLLEKMCILDPSERISVDQAQGHPFIY